MANLSTTPTADLIDIVRLLESDSYTRSLHPLLVSQMDAYTLKLVAEGGELTRGKVQGVRSVLLLFDQIKEELEKRQKET